MSLMPYIESLRIHPLKSGGIIKLDEADVTPLGLKAPDGAIYDRRWALVNERGELTTQRNKAGLQPRGYSILAQSNASLINDANGHAEKVKITMGNAADIVLDPRVYTSNVISFTHFSSKGTGHIVSPEANEFFSDALKQKVRLIYQTDANTRYSDTDYVRPGTPVSLADGFSILVANEITFKKFKDTLPSDVKVSIDNFRPNIVVSNALAGVEYGWARVKTSTGVELVLPKDCTRCVMITHNQETGEFPKQRLSDRPVFAALRKFHQDHFAREAIALTDPIFGVNAAPEKCGRISVRTSFHVLARK